MCVGLTCVDMISVVASFPKEDSDNRCLRQYWSRGGNASNNATVLAILGNEKVSCLSCLSAKDFLCQFILTDFSHFGVDVGHLAFYSEDDEKWKEKNANDGSVNLSARIPLSTCLLSVDTGTRTIAHRNEGAPEVDLTHFEAVDLNDYAWVHFEGRLNVAEIESMIKKIKHFNEGLVGLHDNDSRQRGCVVSVELEKCKPEIDCLINTADVVFISKQRAKMKGFDNAWDAVHGLLPDVSPAALLVIPWGDVGVAAAIAPVDRELDADVVFVEAHHPDQVVDSLGAGDTFIAAVIHSLNRKFTWRWMKVGEKEKVLPTWSRDYLVEALTFGCWLAGEKCSRFGFRELKDWFQEEHSTFGR